jgi:hypothetical protein
MDYGAKGDGQTDDSPAIWKALTAAFQRGIGGGSVVYFPPGHIFVIANAQTLPTPPNIWITLYLDAELLLGGTLTVPGGYIIHGNSSGQVTAFSTDKLALIGHTNLSVNPTIFINSTDVRIENVQFTDLPEGADGIVIKHSAKIVLKNVWIQGHGGIPVRIEGGFGYEIDGGGFASSEDQPTIQFSDNNECDFVGIFRVHGTFLSRRGISVAAGCGGMNSMTFDDILYEGATNAFLTIDSHSSIGVWSIAIRDVNFADSQGDPLPPMIDAHCQVQSGCAGISGVTISNSYTDGLWMATGDPIYDLEIWNSNPRGGTKVAQTRYYVIHDPTRIVNTMPVVDDPNMATFRHREHFPME